MKNKIEKDSFIVEIEEDLKNDNLKKLWDKLGVYVIGSMVLILVSTIGVETYSYFKTKANEAMVEKYTQALNFEASDNFVQAQLGFAEVEAEGGLVKDLAMLQGVDVLLKQEKTIDAYAKLKGIVADKSVCEEIKNIAIMMQASIAVDTKSVDEVAMVISPLLSNDNVWLYNALELLAIAQLKAGNKEGAVELFERIATESMQDSIKTRALDMLAVL